MTDGLDAVLAGSGQPGLGELRDLLRELLAGEGEPRLVDQQPLGQRAKPVFRLRFALNGGGRTRSVVVKRLKPDIARRNELVVKRWLPAIGLAECGTPLLGSVGARSGRAVWHVYDDLGEHELDPLRPDREQVAAAIDLIARMHTRFAEHALLGEVRLHGGDLGIACCEANARDAMRAVSALRPEPARRAVCERLLARLQRLRDELPERAAALAGLGLPETLLHGDLWAINVFVVPAGRDMQARLIDWDHAAAGPVTYDLSTLLLRFPASERAWMLERYREAVAPAGWRVPPLEFLTPVLETHELGRFANCAIWPAIAVGLDGAEWGFDALEEIDGWFAALPGVLAGAEPGVPHGTAR